MKKRISNKARIEHILEAIDQIQVFTSGISYDEYNQDLKLRLALTRLVDIIGEAANHVSEETRTTYVDVDWSLSNRVQTILTHEYFGIDYGIIRESINKDIPHLKSRVEDIMKTPDTGLL